MKANKAEEPSPAEQGRAGQMLRAGSAPKDARAPPRCRQERREGAQGDLSPVCPSSAPLGWWKAGGGPRLALPSGSCSPSSLHPWCPSCPPLPWQPLRQLPDISRLSQLRVFPYFLLFWEGKRPEALQASFFPPGLQEVSGEERCIPGSISVSREEGCTSGSIPVLAAVCNLPWKSGEGLCPFTSKGSL